MASLPPRKITEGRGVACNVRARLEDDANHADGDAHFFDFQSVRTVPRADFIADRVVQHGDVAQTLDHPVNPRIGEFKAVEHCGSESGLLARRQILCIFLLDEIALRVQLFGHRFEDSVLLAG